MTGKEQLGHAAEICALVKAKRFQEAAPLVEADYSQCADAQGSFILRRSWFYEQWAAHERKHDRETAIRLYRKAFDSQYEYASGATSGCEGSMFMMEAERLEKILHLLQNSSS
jgi:mevalonate pyrophosphate decarboxylase